MCVYLVWSNLQVEIVKIVSKQQQKIISASCISEERLFRTKHICNLQTNNRTWGAFYIL